jgi:hypothetical protein
VDQVMAVKSQLTVKYKRAYKRDCYKRTVYISLKLLLDLWLAVVKYL